MILVEEPLSNKVFSDGVGTNGYEGLRRYPKRGNM